MNIKNIRVLKFNEPTKNGRIYRDSSINLNDYVLQEQLSYSIDDLIPIEE